MITHTNAYDNRVRSAILDHLHSFWPNSSISEEGWDEGPIRENVPGFRVLKLRSDTLKRPVIYVTEGCFISEPEAHIRHEFFVISPNEERQQVETLTMLANFHADERFRLDVGSVVNIGESWVPGSTCNHLLISVPYPYGPKLEWLRLPDICVRFLWALPVTAREAAFAELNGFEALEQKFDAVRVDYLNPFRTSVI
jgi:hypothetical protein